MNYSRLISHGIKNLRISHSLTQEQFAEKLDMSIQGYRNIEQGKYLPTAKTIDNICNIFNINPVDLLLPNTYGGAEDLQNIIISKIKSYDLEKLIKIDKMLDIM